MMAKKPLISEEEWMRFNIREEKRVPRDAMPHCFGLAILSLPECNEHAYKKTKKYHNLCQIRHSCALAYAERLKLDVSKTYEGPKEEGFVNLVKLIQTEERRIGYVPEIGRKAESIEPVLKEEVDGDVDYDIDDVEDVEGIKEVVEDVEVNMTSVVPVSKPPVTMKKVAPVKVNKVPTSSSTASVPVRLVIMSILESGEWMSKSQIVSALEIKLNRKPLNHAVLHKISIALLPKTQLSLGYKILKEIRGGVHFYKYEEVLELGTP